MNIFVKKRNISSEQEFSESNIKKIETDFGMTYSNELHFTYSNSPVAPRIDGGYYVAFSDEFTFGSLFNIIFEINFCLRFLFLTILLLFV